MSWRTYLSNSVDLSSLTKFAAILGECPSKGARSPSLWNAAFLDLNLPERMLPFDVRTESDLSHLIMELDADPGFVGGAVTSPYKELVAKFLGHTRLTSEATKIGAVNCLFRNKDGLLSGTNTDGEAALAILETEVGNIAGKQILLLGPGGAGKAVSAFLVATGASLTIAARDANKTTQFADSIGANLIEFPIKSFDVSRIDLLINCTSVGFMDSSGEAMPIDHVTLNCLTPQTVVFDIIYQPLNTPLLAAARKRNLKTINGLAMNLEQAVLGFSHAVKGANFERVRQVMAKSTR